MQTHHSQIFSPTIRCLLFFDLSNIFLRSLQIVFITSHYSLLTFWQNNSWRVSKFIPPIGSQRDRPKDNYFFKKITPLSGSRRNDPKRARFSEKIFSSIGRQRERLKPDKSPNIQLGTFLSFEPNFFENKSPSKWQPARSLDFCTFVKICPSNWQAAKSQKKGKILKKCLSSQQVASEIA